MRPTLVLAAALALWLSAALCATRDAEVAKSLIPNGDFEEGDATPKGWQTVDGLSSFWVKDDDPKHGKVIKFDTDVLQSQGYQWWVKIARGQATAKDAPKKKPTV